MRIVPDLITSFTLFIRAKVQASVEINCKEGKETFHNGITCPLHNENCNIGSDCPLFNAFPKQVETLYGVKLISQEEENKMPYREAVNIARLMDSPIKYEEQSYTVEGLPCSRTNAMIHSAQESVRMYIFKWFGKDGIPSTFISEVIDAVRKAKNRGED